MKRALIYVRVSTPKQAAQGESLEVQEAICRQYAERHDYLVEEVFREPYSGRTSSRPWLQKLFALIDSNGSGIHAVIIRDIDRFTRAGVVLYRDLKSQLVSRGIELIDTAGVIQPVRNTLEDLGFQYDWSMVSPSRASETLAAENASEEVTRFLTRAIGQEIRLAKQGYRTRPAPIGYRNKKIVADDGKRRIILECRVPRSSAVCFPVLIAAKEREVSKNPGLARGWLSPGCQWRGWAISLRGFGFGPKRW